MNYKVVRDGDKWGVLDKTETLINEFPISKADAEKLSNELNHPAKEIYADENIHLEY